MTNNAPPPPVDEAAFLALVDALHKAQIAFFRTKK